MQEYKGTVRREESEDLEVLNLVPSFHESNIKRQSVCIAPLTRHETSIIMSKTNEKGGSSFCHFIFTERETDMLIEALQEVKTRWKENKVIE